MYGDALTTNTRIKSRIGITVDSFDALLDRFIFSITARIEQMTGRRFIQGIYTNELHDGSDVQGSVRTVLVVKNAPIHNVSSVEYKAGTNSAPAWTAFDEDDYDLDAEAGLLYFNGSLPSGKRNIRITYTGGFSGYAIGVNNFWIFNAVPTGAVNGVNLTFTIPHEASQVIVYADGIREAASNVTFVDGTATFTLAAGRAPFSTIAVDYLLATESDDSDVYLPEDLVEVCEKAVVKTFKRRESEGRSSETFQESSITWDKGVFTAEDLATIRNYRRGYYV